MNKNIKTVLVIGFVGLILIFTISIVVIKYRNSFDPNQLSSDPAIWGQFGDYFGGIINPIVGILNLVLFVYLSFILQGLSAKTALMQMKREDLHYFKTEMDRVIKIFDEDPTVFKIEEVNNVFVGMQARMNYVFPEITKSAASLTFSDAIHLLISSGKIMIKHGDVIQIFNFYNELVNVLSQSVNKSIK